VYDRRVLTAWPAEPAADPAAAFATLGAAALGRVLDDDQLAAARAAFDELRPDGTTGPYATIVHDGWRRAPALAALVPVIGAAAARAVGVDELVLFHEHLLWKHPGRRRHGVAPGLLVSPARSPRRLHAVDRPRRRATPTTAASTTSSRLAHHAASTAPRGGSGRTTIRAPTMPPVPDTLDDGVAAPTRAGYAIAHDTLLLHRSPRNRAARPRRAWALSLVTPATRWAPRHAPHPRSAVDPRAGDPLEPDLLRVAR
jgi:hypothetical protein